MLMLQDNIEKAVEVGKSLISAYNGGGIFGHATGDMPELVSPKGMERGSIQHVNYITLLVALDYMREAVQLWKAGIKTFEDDDTRWVFDVNSPKIDDLDLLIETLRKYKVSKKYKKDAKIWQKNAKSIRDLFEGDMKKFLEEECKFR